MEIGEISMLTALAFIAIILLSGGARTYFKRKYDTSAHLKKLDQALARNAKGKQRLHDVQVHR